MRKVGAYFLRHSLTWRDLARRGATWQLAKECVNPFTKLGTFWFLRRTRKFFHLSLSTFFLQCADAQLSFFRDIFKGDTVPMPRFSRASRAMYRPMRRAGVLCG